MCGIVGEASLGALSSVEWIKNALVNKTKYQNKYLDSIKNNNEFWTNLGIFFFI